MATIAGAALPARASTPLLIAFADLTRFAAQSATMSDERLADVVDAFYERVTAAVEPAGGRIVKFIGDAALIVFAEEDADRGVVALLELKPAVDAWFTELGWECRLIIKAHFGEAIAGAYGGRADKRFDVIGKAVNTAAMIDSTGLALSVEAFRQLAPETRKRFKKHTSPVTYIRSEDPHRFRRR